MEEDPRRPLLSNNDNNQYYTQEGCPPPPPYHPQGYQQDNMAYQYNYGNTMQPEATGHVQYRFGPPAPPPSDPPVFNNIVQAPPTAGYYPPTDPGLPTPVPVPRMAVDTHYSLALGLCITWSLLLIWPAAIFSLIAVVFACNSRKLLKVNSYDKARSKGRTSCLCSVASVAVACVYGFGVLMVPLGAYMYYFGNLTANDSYNNHQIYQNNTIIMDL